MKGKGHIQSFNEHQENLNISDVSVQSKHSVGDNVRTKKNIDNVLKTHRQYLVNDNTGIEKYLGKDCKIVYVYYDEKYKYHRYMIDIDNGDYWWVGECFD
jgi:hypothetical protein